MTCRLCGSDRLESVLDLGASPPCERFLTAQQLDEPEPSLPLHLRICPDCLLLQIPNLLRPEDTFVDYAYYSSYSTSWVRHAERLVGTAVERLRLTRQSYVVEVASNDGYLLQHVVARGLPCLGVEPSANCGEEARARGVPTETTFLDATTAQRLRDEHGPADWVVANNVWAHVPDQLDFTRGLRTLVADDGTITIEVHHALNLIREAQFDTIYHEHFSYWTVLAAERTLAVCDLHLVDVELLPTHGGSLRLWATPDPSRPVSPRVAQVERLERRARLDTLDGYAGLPQHVSRIRDDVVALLVESRRNGQSVAGYGAPGKGNTLLNYCGIRPDLLPYLVDRNPYKHGRYTPGTRIPVHDPRHLDEQRPDLVLVLPWNLRRELTEQLAHVAEWGGRLVFAQPTLTIVDPLTMATHVPSRVTTGNPVSAGG